MQQIEISILLMDAFLCQWPILMMVLLTLKMMTLLVCIYSRRADRWGNASLRSVDIAPAENANNGFSNSWKVYVSALV
ncbi:unnamed protein product, partial [Linum tenue]